ncbi:SDR family NAD(P)-dependent oxidoreductase [Pontixanthobacter sp.]|uniref:SDR family NAD(P)-dependent oxidoreductase n=1 Tax=Pontixanthobacter sp. TaxID=2792078 RepID=UPI003C7B9DBF
MSNFGAASTADDVLEGQDLTGKLAFITGGASGLGQETARAMAAKGAQVIIAGRDPGKLGEAAAAIREGSDSVLVETILCDLASLDSIRACAKSAASRFDRIDLLINNAGVMACPFARTADGFEMQFGTNHIGHFLLTNLLIPLIKKGDQPRIVNLSSRGHHLDQVDHDDPHFDHRDYEKWAAYGQSKTANIQFTVGLEKSLAEHGIHSYAVHPGGIMTNLGRHMTDDDMKWMMARFKSEGGDGPKLKTIPQGAATTCYAATAAELAGTGGVYLEDCHIAKVDDTDTNGSVRSYALDPVKAERLWDISQAMVGESFAY